MRINKTGKRERECLEMEERGKNPHTGERREKTETENKSEKHVEREGRRCEGSKPEKKITAAGE